MKKILKPFRDASTVLAVLVCALVIASVASIATASESVFSRDYTYNASDADSKLSSRAIAMEQVKRLLLEELGTYIKSETVIRNSELSRDAVTMLTAGVVRTEIVEEKWDGQTYYIKVEIVADPDSIAESIKELVAQKVSLNDLKESLAQRDEALEETARLRAELEAAKAGLEEVVRLRAELEATKVGLEIAKTDAENSSKDVARLEELRQQYVEETEKVEELQQQYVEETEKMTAYSLWEEGYALFNKRKYEEAREFFTQAIDMNTNMARAYGMRAATYNRTGLYKKALADLNDAIEIQPAVGKLYFGRWYAHKKLRMKKEARADLKKSAELGFWKAKLKLSKKRGNII